MNYEKLMSKKNGEGKDAVDLLNEASELMDKDKFQGAIDLLTEAISLCGHPRFYFNRGYCFFQMKDLKNAVKDFKKSLVNDRGNDLLEHEKQRLYLYQGIILEDSGENDDAIEAYKNSADCGYSGAVTRLEKMGIDYSPNSRDESSQSEEKLNRQSARPAGKASESKTKSASSSDGKASFTGKASKNSSSSDSFIKKSKSNLFLPAIIGFIFGIILILIVSNLPREFPEKPPVQKAAVTSNSLNLRAEPKPNAEVLKILYFGNVVEITGDVNGDFTPVEYDGVQGWVNTSFIVLE